MKQKHGDRELTIKYYVYILKKCLLYNLLLYIALAITNKNFNYITIAITLIIISLIVPLISWLVNENSTNQDDD